VVKDGGDVRCQGVPQFVVAGEVVGMREAFEWISIGVSGAGGKAVLIGSGQYRPLLHIKTSVSAAYGSQAIGWGAVLISSGRYRPLLAIKTSVSAAYGSQAIRWESGTGHYWPVPTTTGYKTSVFGAYGARGASRGLPKRYRSVVASTSRYCV
jgi:hypothetical protein